MTINEILDYVLETPDNANSSVLKDMLNELIEEVPTGYIIADAKLKSIAFSCAEPAEANELIFFDAIIGTDADHLEFVSRISLTSLLEADSKIYYFVPEGQGNPNLLQNIIAYGVEGEGSATVSFTGDSNTDIRTFTTSDDKTAIGIRPTSSTIATLGVTVAWGV